MDTFDEVPQNLLDKTRKDGEICDLDLFRLLYPVSGYGNDEFWLCVGLFRTAAPTSCRGPAGWGQPISER